MATEHDLMLRLPESPDPSPEVREAAIEAALHRFDHLGRGTRLDRQAAPDRSSRRSLMPTRAPQFAAACLVLAVAAPVAWLVARDEVPSQTSKVEPAKVAVANSQATKSEATKPEAARSIFAKAKKQAAQEAADARAPRPAPLTVPADANAPEQDTLARPKMPTPPPVAVASQRAPYPASAQPRAFESGRGATDTARGYRPDEASPPAEPVGRDRFASFSANTFKVVREAPVSTFSIDVDTASYSFVRASLNRNLLPQPAAVRTEELVNYFPYAYPVPKSASEPFRTTASVFPSPWAEGRKIVQIGIKGYAVSAATRPRANLVFLIDTSGSMHAPNRLPLVKQSLALLLGQLQPTDRVAVVTYAGQAGVVLEPTAVSERAKILAAIEHLESGGSTAGAEGIREAYALAERNFDANGVNRVMLATDGDFNVGITDQGELTGFVERQRTKGIYLSIMGFGMGNYNDALMQSLAQNGNGVAAYVDTINEARKVLVEEASSTIFPIAKDVKIQVEFNPATVAEYRLIGYETRLLDRSDFDNDKVDAGEVGSGQTVTALYEIVPVGGPRAIGDLRYDASAASTPRDPNRPRLALPEAGQGAEYAFVKIRYKLPNSDASVLISTPIDRASEKARFEDAPIDARFATAVAGFGELLRGGRHMARFGYDDIVKIATAARGDDPFGYRSGFLQLVRAAKTATALPTNR